MALVAVAVFGAAIWKLPAVLGASWADPAGTFGAAWSEGWSAAQIVPALLMVAAIVAAPLLAYNLVEEASASYVVREDGLLFGVLPGVKVLYPWSAVRGFGPLDPEESEPAYELRVDSRAMQQLHSPLLRWLHQQAWGRSRVPIYAHVAGRDELINEIMERTGMGSKVESRKSKVSGSSV
jgi:hypothetical protein